MCINIYIYTYVKCIICIMYIFQCVHVVPCFPEDNSYHLSLSVAEALRTGSRELIHRRGGEVRDPGSAVPRELRAAPGV